QIRQLTTLYKSQVAKLGYEHSRSVRIESTNGPLYQLIFFSKHEMGKKIWRGISEKGADGQHTFDFG
ncbi:MAG: hypothetical protein KDA71_05235, partial [Planctomycetales bacterium]|nr:hypothetical protein [Planctomycetales bacterium]